MSALIDILPNEMLSHVASFLVHDKQSSGAFACVCGRFYGVAHNVFEKFWKDLAKKNFPEDYKYHVDTGNWWDQPFGKLDKTLSWRQNYVLLMFELNMDDTLQNSDIMKLFKKYVKIQSKGNKMTYYVATEIKNYNVKVITGIKARYYMEAVYKYLSNNKYSISDAFNTVFSYLVDDKDYCWRHFFNILCANMDPPWPTENGILIEELTMIE
uniref:F-box family protein n=1 Tax=Marseillevirus LCMAC202 TaxID=2506606 RepID=A0A481YX84_9VIRU|nr:MAG: F-box family protein [Marseillevirus LCMAC202]